MQANYSEQVNYLEQVNYYAIVRFIEEANMKMKVRHLTSPLNQVTRTQPFHQAIKILCSHLRIKRIQSYHTLMNINRDLKRWNLGVMIHQDW